MIEVALPSTASSQKSSFRAVLFLTALVLCLRRLLRMLDTPESGDPAAVLTNASLTRTCPGVGIQVFGLGV